MSATWRPKHPPCRRRRCCSPPRSPFFFHGSIRMLSGLNWFVALCVCCLRVSCRAFVSCVVCLMVGGASSFVEEARPPMAAGRGDSEELRFTDTITINRYYVPLSKLPPSPSRAAPRRAESLSFTTFVLNILQIHGLHFTARAYSRPSSDDLRAHAYLCTCKHEHAHVHRSAAA